MTRILVTNDDGIDSPAIGPLMDALAPHGETTGVFPDRERSWVSKAITRHDPVHVQRVEGRERLWTTTGYPADCTQLGIHALSAERPDLVVSGINIGYNHGLAFMLSSGTVGAAVEAWIVGIPAVAVSLGASGEWATWSKMARTAASIPMWQTAAAIAADVVGDLLAAGWPDEVDLVSVNIPSGVGVDAPRAVTGLARVGYDRLFRRDGDDRYVHDFGGGLAHRGDLDGSDVEAANDGIVSITPLQLPRTAPLDGDLRRRLERA